MEQKQLIPLHGCAMKMERQVFHNTYCTYMCIKVHNFTLFRSMCDYCSMYPCFHCSAINNLKLSNPVLYMFMYVRICTYSYILQQVGTLAVDGPSIPLWCVFASKHASRWVAGTSIFLTFFLFVFLIFFLFLFLLHPLLQFEI